MTQRAHVGGTLHKVNREDKTRLLTWTLGGAAVAGLVRLVRSGGQRLPELVSFRAASIVPTPTPLPALLPTKPNTTQAKYAAPKTAGGSLGGFPLNLAERQAYILDAVRNGDFDVIWSPITSSANGHTATFWVTSDALKINGVRVSASAYLQQQIADAIGARLLTGKLADLLFTQAQVRLPPFTRPITSQTSAMIEQSQKIDAAIAKLGATDAAAKGAIVNTVGKHWILDNQLASGKRVAVNYGWHHVTLMGGVPNDPTVSGAKDPATGKPITVIQCACTAHDEFQDDYSQIVQLVASKATVDGAEMSIDKVLTDPALAPLASHQGPLKMLRQPRVPIEGVVAV